MLLTFSIIMLICFVLVKLLPLPEVLDERYREAILARREMLGYNKPILVQFGLLAKYVITDWNWGLGETYMTGLEVADVFAEKLPATMIVNLWSIILSIPIGIALGVWAALKKNSITDHTISTVVMLSISVPSFVYAFLVQYLFCFKLGWFDMQMLALGECMKKMGYDLNLVGYDDLSWIKQAGVYFSLPMFLSIMPAIMSLSFGTIAGFTRVTRAELTEVLTSEFMLLARTKGLTKAQATYRHAMRNCMVVILPAIFGQFIGILGGSLVIEKIFGIPGVGELYLGSITARDYNFFMMLTAFYTFIGLAAGIVVDISYGFIDPRIRMGAKK